MPKVPGTRQLDNYAVARQEGDEILAREARLVTAWDRTTQQLGMRCRMHVVQDPKALGIAAPQLGIPYRMLAYRSAPDDPAAVHVLTNPEVVEVLGSRLTELEGCFSIGRDRMVPVTRSELVKVRGMDLAGGPVEVKAHGLVARVLQHEIDHLNGRLITHYGSVLDVDEQRAWMKARAIAGR